MAPTELAAPATTRATRARHWVLVFAATLSVITYIDRVCISKFSTPIQKDLGLSDVQMGWVFAAFAWAYALFEVPGGWLGDRIGPRKVLMRVVLMWSVFTALTGSAHGFVTLLIYRFWFGAGEAGCYPNLAKAFTNWLPSQERRRAASVMWLSARWGGAITPLLVVWLYYLVGWRWSFGVFGVVGIAWAVLFFWWFRDNPREHPSVNAAELALLPDSQRNAATHAQVPWERFLSSATVWLLAIQYFCFGYGWYFYITWLPRYLSETRGMNLQASPLLTWIPRLLEGHLRPDAIKEVQLALLNGIPLFFGGLGCITAAWLATALTRGGYNVAKVRRGIAFGGYLGAAVMLLLSPRIADPGLGMLAMGLASFSLDLALIICWDTCMAVGGKIAGTLSGTMNMSAQFAGVVAPVVVGYILQYMNHNWALTFLISAAIYAFGGICWLFIDPVTPIDVEIQTVICPDPNCAAKNRADARFCERCGREL
jgi:MFS family permease